MSAETEVINSEANDRAVVISEEIDFFEELLAHELPAESVTLIVERRDLLRDSIRATVQAAPPDGIAEEGFVVPDEVEGAAIVSEAYDLEDWVDTEAEDEDHEFVSDRSGKRCLVCGQTVEACSEEP